MLPGHHFYRLSHWLFRYVSVGAKESNATTQQENRSGEKIPLITFAILLVSLSSCSFGKVTLRDAPLEQTAENVDCRGCHEKLSPFHHPTGQGETNRCISNASNKDLNCSYCHAAYTARNHDKGKKPVLALENGLLTEDDLCLGCHPGDNPTCKDEYRGTASHFMGDPTQPETYDDQKPPLKTSPWPVTKLSSEYVGKNGKGIGCLSCHVFRKGPGSTLTEPLPHHLLAIAGERYDLGEDRDDYLCTGCHGLIPPKQPRRADHPIKEILSATVPLSRAQYVIPPATITETGHMNCLSCHRIHGAMPQGGYYLLKRVDSSNTDPKAIHPQVDFLVLLLLIFNPYTGYE